MIRDLKRFRFKFSFMLHEKLCLILLAVGFLIRKIAIPRRMAAWSPKSVVQRVMYEMSRHDATNFDLT